MTTQTDKPHHPLPKDERARHDLLPESIENTRDQGDDDPEAPTPSRTEPPGKPYRDPDGRAYEA